MARFERWAELDQRTWSLGTAARCRAQLTKGDDAERHYQAALAVDGLGERPFQLARTELAYGEWLRRARRRADARPHLRTALELFERLAATPWADQARTELRATGETARRRDPSTLHDLTPQEREIAGLAAQGLSNQQIADRLFLSRHTVGYHLHKVYAKLGRQLARPAAPARPRRARPVTGAPLQRPIPSRTVVPSAPDSMASVSLSCLAIQRPVPWAASPFPGGR